MQKLLFLTAGACLWVLVAVPAPAQASRPQMLKGNVPFEFVSGDRTIPAGKYSIELAERYIWVIDANGHRLEAVVTNPRQGNRKDEQPRLVFRQNGDRYFLWQIWTRSHRLDLPMRRAEQDLRGSLNNHQNTVTIAMR
jgi:hypothetical protein